MIALVRQAQQLARERRVDGFGVDRVALDESTLLASLSRSMPRSEEQDKAEQRIAMKRESLEDAGLTPSLAWRLIVSREMARRRRAKFWRRVRALPLHIFDAAVVRLALVKART